MINQVFKGINKTVSTEQAIFEIDTHRAAKLSFLTLLYTDIFLLMADSHLSYSNRFELNDNIRALFNITWEQSIATWFSSMHFFFIAFCVMLHGCLEMRLTLPHKRLKTVAWFSLALFFVYLSIDDAGRVHERLGATLADKLDVQKSGAIWETIALYPSYFWQVIYAPLIAGFGGSLLLLGWLTFKKNLDKFIIAAGFGILFVSQCLDYIEGKDGGLLFLQNGFNLTLNEATRIIRSVEEFMEMIGMATIIWALLRNFSEYVPTVKINLVLHDSDSEPK